MLEFAIFKQNAMHLPRYLMRCNAKNMGCMGFFSAILPSTGSIDDALTIQMIANSLSEENDGVLLNYVRAFSKYGIVSDEEFGAFKSKVLVGIYLLMWSHYNSSVSSYLNNSFIKYLQMDLGINSIDEMDDELFKSSLDTLSYYCTFIYQNKENNEFSNLNKRLGISIQADIETVRQSRFIPDNSWFGAYSGMFCSLWMTNKS
ncbi:hypothetical protein [uncultured Legionella sp.]|uniref:hypothetical protein n=1 Tax=uncultured Legionella sp. TaxID=210934 RepID=UPI002615283F|nr:hypothetical protein [uncultured Legionella sp.]